MKALGAMLKDEQRARPGFAAARAGRRAYMRSHRAQKKLEEMRKSGTRTYVKHECSATPREPRYLCHFCCGMSWCRESEGCPLGPVGCGLPFAPERIR